MITKDTICGIATPIAESLGLFVVEVTVASGNEIEIIIDSLTRLSIEECGKLSRAVEEHLDRETEDFSLSVASAGIGYPVKLPQQLGKLIGKQIEVLFKNGLKQTATLTTHQTTLNENRNLTGTIQVTFQTKEIPEGKKRKEIIQHNQTWSLNDLKSIVEILDIK